MTHARAVLFAAFILFLSVFLLSAPVYGADDGFAGELSLDDSVFFGLYEQDNDMQNGPEPIEWMIYWTDLKNSRILLLSRYGLDAQKYHEFVRNFKVVLWETSQIRSWLNDSFYQTAFRPEEQAAILASYHGNDGYYSFQSVPEDGHDALDRVFLLSYQNVRNDRPLCTATDYAIARGVKPRGYSVNGKQIADWWLRTSRTLKGETHGAYHILYAQYNPALRSEPDTKGVLTETSMWSEQVAVRPAVWVDLNSVTLIPVDPAVSGAPDGKNALFAVPIGRDDFVPAGYRLGGGDASFSAEITEPPEQAVCRIESVTSDNDPLVFINDPENNAIRLTVATSIPVSAVKAWVIYSQPDRYGEDAVRGELALDDLLSDQGSADSFSFTYRPDAPGVYNFRFMPASIPFSAAESGYSGQYFAVEYLAGETRYFHDGEYGALYEQPSCLSVSTPVKWDKPVTLLGRLNDCWLYASSADGHPGFVEAATVKPEMNPVIRRGFFLASQVTTYDGSDLGEAIERSMPLARQIFLGAGCAEEDILLLRDLDMDTLSRIFDSMTAADFNDVTYICILGHGLTPQTHPERGGWIPFEFLDEARVKDPDYQQYYLSRCLLTNEALYRYLSRINGNVVLLLDACYAGALIDPGYAPTAGGNPLLSLDKARYTVIAAANAEQMAYYFTPGDSSYWIVSDDPDVNFKSEIEEGSLFLGRILRTCFLSDAADADPDDGGITLGEMRSRVRQVYGLTAFMQKDGKKGHIVIPGSEIVYYGSDGSLIFPR